MASGRFVKRESKPKQPKSPKKMGRKAKLWLVVKLEKR